MVLEGEFILNDKKTKPVKQPIKTGDKERTAAPPFLSKSPGPFTTFLTRPNGIIFQNQEPDEIILLIIRRAFITNVPWILIALALAILPLIIIPLLPSLFPFLSITPFAGVLTVSFYYLTLFGYILTQFTIWYFNIGLFTNKRIVDVDVSGILYKNVSETNLSLIQDVSYTQIGSIRSLFNYGDIMIQTAGSLPNFEFDRAPQPAKIVRIMSDLITDNNNDIS